MIAKAVPSKILSARTSCSRVMLRVDSWAELWGTSRIQINESTAGLCSMKTRDCVERTKLMMLSYATASGLDQAGTKKCGSEEMIRTFRQGGRLDNPQIPINLGKLAGPSAWVVRDNPMNTIEYPNRLEYFLPSAHSKQCYVRHGSRPGGFVTLPCVDQGRGRDLLLRQL